MKLSKKIFALVFLVLTCQFLTAAPQGIPVPFRTCDGRPGSVLKADVPEQGNFLILITKKPADAQTFYKIFHDNQYLYLGIRAMEPQPERMRRKPVPHDGGALWYNDGIEFNAIVRGDETKIFKIAFDSLGNIADAYGVDDNVGTSTFIYDFQYESHAKVISTKVEKDCWILEAAIPLGAFNTGNDGKFHPINFQIGRSRFAVIPANGRRPEEYSASTPVDKDSFSIVREYAPLELQNFKNSDLIWQLNDVTRKVIGNKDGSLCRVNGSIVNRDSRFHFAKLRLILADRTGKQIATAEKNLGCQPGKLAQFSLDLPFVKNGEHHLRTEILTAKGVLLAESNTAFMLDYHPIAIRFRTPWYRDNIYASMPKIDKIEVEILLEEHIGEALDVKLTGPNGFVKNQRIPRTEKSNLVTFDFVNMPDGDYYVEALGLRRRLRKLPFSPGEVWLDREGNTYREGKKMLFLGHFGLPNDRGEGINLNQTFVSPWRSRQQQRAWLDDCEKTGRYALIYPYHRYPVPYTYSWAPFAHDDMMKASLSQEQKKILQGFVDEIRGHRGFFGHFIADEPEGRNENPEIYRAITEYLTEIDPYHPTHVSHYGVDGVRRYLGTADITGLDTYWDFFKDNKYNMAPEMSYRTAKATSDCGPANFFTIQAFDWGHINKFGGKSRAPTFDEMRAQVFMGLLGNTKGIVVFSYSTCGGSFSHQLRIGDLHLLKEPYAMQEILLEKSDMTSVKAAKPILIGVKRLGKQFMIIAVNPSLNQVTTQVTANFPLPQKLAVSGEKRSVSPVNNSFTDTFGPMDTHVYLTDGLPANSIDLAAVRAEIKKADEARFKPGNLAAAGELGLAEIREYRQKGAPGAPKITVSSNVPLSDPAIAFEYFLQDGICENIPATIWPTWSPKANDLHPWVELDFGKAVKASKMVVWSLIKKMDAPSPILDAHVEILQNGSWQKAGEIHGNTKATFEIPLSKGEFTKIRLVIDKIDASKMSSRLLSEIEVMK